MIWLIIVIYIFMWISLSAFAYNEEKKKGNLFRHNELSYFIVGIFWPIWVVLGIPYAIYLWLIKD